MSKKPKIRRYRLRRADPRFYKSCVQWSAQYLCDEHSRPIQNYAQALRVRKDAYERIDGDVLRDLRRYLKANYR